jgi:ankyrin repeat protein
MSLKRNAFWGAIPPGGMTTGVSDILDCTTECSAREHSLLVLSSAYLGNLKLLKHCATVCNNPVDIVDSLGRNALHVAASKGYVPLVLWLLARKKVKVDVFDWESKWTALHRSTFYGQLGIAALLIKVYNGLALG